MIATTGPHQSVYGGGNGDAFLAKFDFFGVRQWGTYYGGSGGDDGSGCVCDATGNIYLVGSTRSASAIATPGSHQTVYQSPGATDAFLVKFNSNGFRLWSTYYGGNSYDIPTGCSIDLNNNVYIAGYTNSTTTTLVATPGSHQPTYTGWNYIGFLAKFNSSGVIQWGTFYGAGGDFVNACATDPSGNVYIAGRSQNSGTLIATLGSHQPANGANGYNAFLVKFDGSGVRQWGTFYGGSDQEIGYACATDASGNVYLAGISGSTLSGVIATSGSHQSAHAGGSYNSDAFLAKFNSGGVRQWATYYGGIAGETGFSCLTDASGDVYLAGTVTGSVASTVIATNGSHQSAYGGGGSDAFLVKFSAGGIRQWGTYYGGTGDEGDKVFLCNNVYGNIYLGGTTTTTLGTAIATPGSHQPAYAGGINDAFLVKFDVCDLAPVPPAAINVASVICVSVANSYSTALTFGASSYTWSFPGNWSFLSNTNTVSATPGSSGVLTLQAGNACGISQQTLNLVVNPLPTVSVNSGTMCFGQSFTLVPNGAATYSYSGGSVVSPATTSAYSVTGTSAAGCISSNTAVASVTVYSLPSVSVTSGAVCVGESFTIVAGGANTYSYSSGPVVSPAVTTSYSVTGTDVLGCSKTVLSSVVVNPLPLISVNSGAICLGQSFTLSPTGANTYTYSSGPVVSPGITTSYSVTGTSSAGCIGSNTAVSNVTVSTIHPTITVNSGSICQGRSFTIVPSGASTYTIQGGASVVSPNATTNYTVAGTSTAGCISANTVISSVTVNPLPEINVTTSATFLCLGESAVLTAGGGTSYTFNPAGTGTSISISPTITTTYTITGTDASGCRNTALITQSVSECTGIEVTNANKTITLYPNPTKGVVNLGLFSFNEVVVMNLVGEIVYSSHFNPGLHQINLESLAKGIYIVKLNNSSQAIKLIKD